MPSKPNFTVSELFARAREAKHDALGVANDPDALVALAVLRRQELLRKKTLATFRPWSELVQDIAALARLQPGNEALQRWVSLECVRLGVACKKLGADDPMPFEQETVARVSGLPANERAELIRRFQLDWDSPLIVAEEARLEESDG